MARFYNDEIRRQSQMMPQMEIEPSMVQGFFDKIQHKLTAMNHHLLTAKELADLFAPIEGIDVEIKVPESMVA